MRAFSRIVSTLLLLLIVIGASLTFYYSALGLLQDFGKIPTIFNEQTRKIVRVESAIWAYNPDINKYVYLFYVYANYDLDENELIPSPPTFPYSIVRKGSHYEVLYVTDSKHLRLLNKLVRAREVNGPYDTAIVQAKVVRSLHFSPPKEDRYDSYGFFGDKNIVKLEVALKNKATYPISRLLQIEGACIEDKNSVSYPILPGGSNKTVVSLRTTSVSGCELNILTPGDEENSDNNVSVDINILHLRYCFDQSSCLSLLNSYKSTNLLLIPSSSLDVSSVDLLGSTIDYNGNSEVYSLSFEDVNNVTVRNANLFTLTLERTKGITIDSVSAEYFSVGSINNVVDEVDVYDSSFGSVLSMAKRLSLYNVEILPKNRYRNSLKARKGAVYLTDTKIYVPDDVISLSYYWEPIRIEEGAVYATSSDCIINGVSYPITTVTQETFDLSGGTVTLDDPNVCVYLVEGNVFSSDRVEGNLILRLNFEKPWHPVVLKLADINIISSDVSGVVSPIKTADNVNIRIIETNITSGDQFAVWPIYCEPSSVRFSFVKSNLRASKATLRLCGSIELLDVNIFSGIGKFLYDRPNTFDLSAKNAHCVEGTNSYEINVVRSFSGSLDLSGLSSLCAVVFIDSNVTVAGSVYRDFNTVFLAASDSIIRVENTSVESKGTFLSASESNIVLISSNIESNNGSGISIYLGLLEANDSNITAGEYGIGVSYSSFTLNDVNITADEYGIYNVFSYESMPSTAKNVVIDSNYTGVRVEWVELNVLSSEIYGKSKGIDIFNAKIRVFDSEVRSNSYGVVFSGDGKNILIELKDTNILTSTDGYKFLVSRVADLNIYLHASGLDLNYCGNTWLLGDSTVNLSCICENGHTIYVDTPPPGVNVSDCSCLSTC